MKTTFATVNVLRTLLFSSMMLFAAVGFTSCNKCVDCDGCPVGIEAEICRDDFDSEDDYDDAVDAAEFAGCECN